MKKQDSQHCSLPHVVTVDGFQVLLSSINGLPSFPVRRKYFSYSSPTQYRCRINSANDPQDPYPTPCTLAMSGLWTPVQHPFSFALACSSNRVPHSNKFYFPLILSQVWKFFSNTTPGHKKGYYPIRPVEVCKTKFQLKYEFLPQYSVSLWFKILIHRAEFSTLLTQITLLKMWRFGPTSELLVQNALKKKVLFL